MVVLVLGRAGRHFNQGGLHGFYGAQESLDAFDLADPPVCGFDRAVAEVFLHPEHVNPSLRDGEPNGYVLARDLAVLAADVAWHQHVRFQLHPVAGYAESRPDLERQFPVLGRADAES